jgi:hypothetical protein
MSQITLHADIDHEVATPSFFESFVGDPAKRLMIFSGIAIPSIKVNHDEDIYQNEVVVRLRQYATILHSSVCHVALASVSNDESAFVFAVDSGKLELEHFSGELILRVNTATMGEHTGLHRFSYQVVAHVSAVAARISGTIRVPKAIRDVCPEWDRDGRSVQALFSPTANRRDEDRSGMFVVEKFVPLAHGSITGARSGKEDCFLDYVIDNCPFNVPLHVQVNLASWFPSPPCFCGPEKPPAIVTLTTAAPEASGIDFVVSRMVVK